MKISNLESTVLISRALAHQARLRILAALRSGEMCACQVTEILGLAQSTVSSHLRELKLAGLIGERKDGRWVYFRLAQDPEAAVWIETALAALGDDPQLEEDSTLAGELRRLPVEDLCRLGYEEARARAGLDAFASSSEEPSP